MKIQGGGAIHGERLASFDECKPNLLINQRAFQVVIEEVSTWIRQGGAKSERKDISLVLSLIMLCDPTIIDIQTYRRLFRVPVDTVTPASPPC